MDISVSSTNNQFDELVKLPNDKSDLRRNRIKAQKQIMIPQQRTWH